MWPNFALLLLMLMGTEAIVNPSNESANMVIYMLPGKDVGPHTWQVGVDCLDSFAQIFFYRNPMERFTRAYNLMMTNVYNMSLPAALIQKGFSKRINEAISNTSMPKEREFYQLRVISDQLNSKPSKIFGEILLADNYVIVVDSVERLQKMMSKYLTKSRSWNPGARFLVLYHNPELRDKPWKIASTIFNDLMTKFYVHRVALLYANSSTDYNLLVNDYYSNIDCRVLSVQSVGQCQNGQLYPSSHAVHVSMLDYISGFSPRNCTFYVCCSIAAPFVEEDCIVGLEMRILGFVRNRLGFETNQTCTRDTRGEVDEDGNWNGLLGKLSEGECDFIMGGFYPDNEVTVDFWGSDCYLQDAHTWFTKLADHRPAWRAMIGIFAWNTWVSFLLVLVLTWLFWYALVRILPEPKYFQQLSLTAINALAVSIGVAVQERPICEATRLFFLSLTLYGINLVATYTSKMIETFQYPGYLHQLDDLEEVVAAGIPFGGEEESRDWFENDDDMWIFKGYNSSVDFRPRTKNLQDVEEGLRCILSSRMYIMQNRHADDIFAFPQNVFTSPMQMIMKAGFPFMFEINMVIRYMRDVGIIAKIDSDFRFNNTYLNRIAKMRPNFADNAIVLTTEHVKGPFGILIFGICSALLAFLLELLYVYRGCRLRRRQRRRQLRRTKWRRERYQLRQAMAPVVRFTPVKRRKVL
ncbi:uncharacterized protein LOC133844204 [Drosophila sulfurigaster albostrigata]|uniref:uncharacterized protein LOC133844204 n=1 Tax=Drosophila sulfurigaster albostrigata TaxID=89887 RepID=UPI002D21D958|nr:uncharacterized protein LOC133844204 [Drosophila sulfurigaster albostrigata]